MLSGQNRETFAVLIQSSSERHYTYYVLALFMLANLFNFLDRQILAILLEQIKRDLQVSDTAMGFLGGFAFALFYAFAGLPIARLADRGSRRTIMAAGIALWSAATALCGAARGFTQLALFRVGVGVGEAALTPCAHSMLSDYFPPEKRATVISIYTVGAHLGLAVGLPLGGWIATHYGWRPAFVVVALPGLLVALAVRLTVREPIRGSSEGGGSERSGSEGAENNAESQSFADVIGVLWRLRSFRHLAFAASLQAFFGYGFLGWAPAFLIRVHGMSEVQLGWSLGLILGFGGAVGTFFGGWVVDKLGGRDSRRYMQVPAFAALITTPFALLFLHYPAVSWALVLYVPAVVIGNIYPAPVYATTQNLVAPHMRGVAASVLLLVINLIGLGLGPQLVGILNDVLEPRFGTEAIRYSMSIVGVANVWAAVHFLLAARTLREDLERRGLAN